MRSWWTPRRVVFLVLGWLALGLASVNASAVESDRRVPYFIGGALWAVIFFAVALWPGRKPPRARGRGEPSRPPAPWRPKPD